jgi:general L-amino acid transport system permease protein
MEKTTHSRTADSVRPPTTSIGVIGWMRANLFNGWFNSLLTLVVAYLLWSTVPPFIKWAFINSN